MTGMEFAAEERFAAAARAECLARAEDIVRIIESSPLTPVNTGRLKRSYAAKAVHDGAEITSTAPYWKYVEYGSGRGPEQPHVRPAIEQIRAEYT